MNITLKFEGQTVGHATAQDGRFKFSYYDGWLQTRGFPISLRLPTSSKQYSADVAHAFFANLLPEGNARSAICGKLGISENDDVTLLERLGSDTAGAFEFCGDEPAPERHREKILEADLVEWVEGAPPIPASGVTRLSLAGAQHKISVVVEEQNRFFVPAYNEPSTHILKFNSPQYPDLCQNEFFCNRFADNLGLETVVSSLNSIGDLKFLTIERYDRIYKNGQIARLHQEDFCQLTNTLPSDKYQSQGGPGLRRIAELIRRYATSPLRELDRFLEWIVVCILCGNADAHAKNISLLYAEDVRLAPCYDLVCTRAYKHLSQDQAMTVGGSWNPDQITASRWEQLGTEIGLPNARERVTKIIDRAADALEKTSENFDCSDEVRKQIKKRIRAQKTNLEQK